MAVIGDPHGGVEPVRPAELRRAVIGARILDAQIHPHADLGTGVLHQHGEVRYLLLALGGQRGRKAVSIARLAHQGAGARNVARTLRH